MLNTDARAFFDWSEEDALFSILCIVFRLSPEAIANSS